MKILDRIGLVVFSTLILLGGLAVVLTIAGWLDLNLVIEGIEYIVTEDVISKVIFGISIALILIGKKIIKVIIKKYSFFILLTTSLIFI